mgnify:FL=1|jgi:hypothetical protein
MANKVNYKDGIFDELWVKELAHRVHALPWYASNVANRVGWPYYKTGSHTIFGNLFFKKHSLNDIYYDKIDHQLNLDLINTFNHICKDQKLNLDLVTIDGNLQFMGMDGTAHTDGPPNHTVFILMLCAFDVPKNIGGEFVHCPSKKVIPFKSGRLITMNAADLHYAKAFNKPNIARFSIKWVGSAR